MVKDFWAVPEYAELLDSMNKRLHPFIVGHKGTAEEALTGVANDWASTFKQVQALAQVSVSDRRGGSGPLIVPRCGRCQSTTRSTAWHDGGSRIQTEEHDVSQA